MDLKKYIYDIPDFPTPGIMFRDITPLLADAEAFKATCDDLADYIKKVGGEVLVAPESRGFVFGCPVAVANNLSFIPIRKPGKLPREVISVKYDLEYGSNELQIHKDAIKPGQKVVVIDDLLATGGSAMAAIKLVEQLGGEVVGLCFVIELDALKGREVLKDYDVYSIIHY